LSNTDLKHFELKTGRDTINFVVLSDDYDVKKPVLIFLQGSTPVPLAVDYNYNNERDLLVFSFLKGTTIEELKRKYHLVAISMPTVPLVVDVKNLDANVWYVKEKEPESIFHTEYHIANVMSNYVKRTKKVIDYLYKQSWANKNHISVFGHSQGAKIALLASVNNKKVYKVGFSGGNPFGRTDHTLRGWRYAALMNGEHDQEQHYIDSFYRAWEDMVKNPSSLEIEYADANRTWLSFDEPLIPYFLKLKQPIYVCYGTVDPKSVMCDVLPIYFISAGKQNLTMKPYPGLEHNYCQVDEKLKPKGEGIWDEVMVAFVKWDIAQ
jgi:pimeloyl-ACP methyl ester carboxylesterase